MIASGTVEARGQTTEAATKVYRVGDGVIMPKDGTPVPTKITVEMNFTLR